MPPPPYLFLGQWERVCPVSLLMCCNFPGNVSDPRRDLVSLCGRHHGLQLVRQFPGWPLQELVVCSQTRAPTGHSVEGDIQD